ncbi:hypothetical protein CDZ95_27970 [Mameliella alba]|nr:hypothetical protein CDZ95_27970 [Mameliella alba]
MNAQMIGELTEAAKALAEDSSVRAVILTGEGRSFCAGGDLGWMRAQAEQDRAGKMQEAGSLAGMLGLWNALPKPVIGQVQGAAYGGGIGLIAVCDIVIALGPSGTGKTHVALGLGLAACQKGMSVGFITAAALVNELMEARDERRLLRVQKQMAGVKLLIIDELGFVPLSKTGAELLFELISQRYERGATMITSNLPFDEWTETFGTERLTGALLDRLTHHVNIIEMNGESYRLAQSRARKAEAPT